MASDFKVFIYRNSDNIHLKLAGEFDDSSAHQLFNILNGVFGEVGKIFIHTVGLSFIHSFGKDAFKNKCCAIKELIPSMIFTGKLGSELALPGSKYIP